MLITLIKFYRNNQTRDEIISELREFDVKKFTPPLPRKVKLTNSHFEDLHKNDMLFKHKKENA